MKRVDLSVRRNFPAFRQTRDRSRRFRIKPRQPFKQADINSHFRNARQQRRIERFRFGLIDDGDVGGRLVAGAAGNQNKGSEKKNKTRPRKKSPGALENGHRLTLPAPARRTCSCLQTPEFAASSCCLLKAWSPVAKPAARWTAERLVFAFVFPGRPSQMRMRSGHDANCP